MLRLRCQNEEFDAKVVAVPQSPVVRSFRGEIFIDI